jgi:transcriptional regulator with XRE-family HTH domain
MRSPSENIRLARTRIGLEPEDVARAVGLNVPWYRDVEGHDDEVTGNVSLGTLMAIARTLNTTTVELLEGPGALDGASKRSGLELADLARARIASDGLTVKEYGDRIGWDMAPVLAAPEHLQRYPVVMLQALCHDLGVDWKAFVDGTALSNREDPLQVSGDIVNTRPSGTKPR